MNTKLLRKELEGKGQIAIYQRAISQSPSLSANCDFCDEDANTLLIEIDCGLAGGGVEICADCLREAGIEQFLAENPAKPETQEATQ